MDFLLPDEEAMIKMCNEYQSCLKKSATLSYINEISSDTQNAPDVACDVSASENDSFDELTNRIRARADVFLTKVLFLYIVALLRYNARYGTQIYDTDGGVGRVRRASSAFGSLNHLKSYDG